MRQSLHGHRVSKLSKVEIPIEEAQTVTCTMSLVMDLEVPRKLDTLSSLGSKTWINAWYLQLVACSPVCNLVTVIGPGCRWRLALVRYTRAGLVRPGSLDFADSN